MKYWKSRMLNDAWQRQQLKICISFLPIRFVFFIMVNIFSINFDFKRKIYHVL